MRLKYIDYCNRYEFLINGYESGLIKDVCFSLLFNKCRNKNNNGWMKIWISTDSKLNEAGKSHYCILSEEEVKFYFNWVKIITGIKFRYEKTNFELAGCKCGGYLVTANFNNISGCLIKTFATLIRNVYEFPFNIQVKAAILSKDIKGFKKLGFTERLVLAIDSITNNENRDVHAIYNPIYTHYLTNRSELKKHINKGSNEDRHNVSDTIRNNFDKFCNDKIFIEGSSEISEVENNMIPKILLDKLIETYKNKRNE